MLSVAQKTAQALRILEMGIRNLKDELQRQEEKLDRIIAEKRAGAREVDLLIVKLRKELKREEKKLEKKLTRVRGRNS